MNVQQPTGPPHGATACSGYHDVVRDFGGGRKPRITVLCGSTRFGRWYREMNLRLTMAGDIVLSIGCDTRSDHALWAVLGPDEMGKIKGRLDALHLRKIDLADRVYVLNVGGYIGESTRREIEYATKLGKPIEYLESPDEPTEALGPEMVYAVREGDGDLLAVCSTREAAERWLEAHVRRNIAENYYGRDVPRDVAFEWRGGSLGFEHPRPGWSDRWRTVSEWIDAVAIDPEVPGVE